MAEPHDRLLEIRKARFASAAEAARALNVAVPTYTAHENGTRGFARRAARYAAFFRVSVEWLLTGRGERRGQGGTIPVVGHVGANAVILPVSDEAMESAAPLDEVELPDTEHLAAYEVRGDSQWPRYLDGEIVLFDTRETKPSQLLDQYAIVDLADGRRVLKLLRRTPQSGRFRLDSHNAPPLDGADIVSAFRVRGTLTR